jgi:hypothetical protein
MVNMAVVNEWRAKEWRTVTKKEVEALSKRMNLLGVFNFDTEWVVFYLTGKTRTIANYIPYARRLEPLPGERAATYQINQKNINAWVELNQ